MSTLSLRGLAIITDVTAVLFFAAWLSFPVWLS